MRFLTNSRSRGYEYNPGAKRGGFAARSPHIYCGDVCSVHALQKRFEIGVKRTVDRLFILCDRIIGQAGIPARLRLDLKAPDCVFNRSAGPFFLGGRLECEERIDIEHEYIRTLRQRILQDQTKLTMQRSGVQPVKSGISVNRSA